MEEKKGWKAELTDVLGRCVQSQDKNLWIANILNLVEQELEKAREEGKREQAELDRALYSVSFEHIKNADFEKILLESVKKAREEGYQNCMDDIWEEARGLRSWTEHDGSISSANIEAGLQEAYLNIEAKLKDNR